MASKNSGRKTRQDSTLNSTRQAVLDRLDPVAREMMFGLENQIERFTEIGIALSREKDMAKLLEMILEEAKRITNADGRTLYMMTDDQRLKFEIVRTDSLDFHMGGTSGKEIPFYPVKLYLENGEPNHKMIAAHVGLTGEVVNIPDAYRAEGFDFSGTKAFDKKTGYRSKSFLTVPLKNHLEEIIGVIQLLNAQDSKTGEVIPFSKDRQALVESLCSQAAVAITNKQLIRQLEELFDAFIKVIAASIDAKSPYTGGHCQRVPILTRMLAEAVNRTKEGPYADLYFDDESMRELMISAWLHDAGKVVTPVHVVDKGTKLETLYDRVQDIIARFEVLKRDEEIRYLKRRAKLEKQGKGNEIPKLRKRYKDRIAQLDEDCDFIKTMNTGGEFLSPDKKERLLKIAKYQWKSGGKKRDFLSEGEIHNLCISRGTLTPEERQIINDHMVHGINMLNGLPWPKGLEDVPLYAGAHHEKLDGTGYPRGLTAKELPVQPRLVTIADVFEALTAADRPYKKGKTLSQSLKIMGFMRNDYHLDPDLFDIFIKEKVYENYAREYLRPEQIDEVNIQV